MAGRHRRCTDRHSLRKAAAELFSNAGLVILPAYYEGLPTALLEAMSYELPVLVSDIPQHKEVPLPEKRYFAVGNVDQLAVKMKALLAEGIDEEEKARQRAMIEERYNWDRIAEATLGVYRSIGK